MFMTISKPYNPIPALLGFAIVAGALGIEFLLPLCWLQELVFEPHVPGLPAGHIMRLVTPARVLARALSRARKPAVASDAPGKHSASTVLGTPSWAQHAARGRNVDLQIVAENSLPVLRAYRVPLAIDVRRPRGRTLLYNPQDGTLTQGTVADDAVPRELEGLPAEFERPLGEAERELGSRPHVFACYSADLYSVLRSLTVEALQQSSIPVSSVRTARVRLSLSAGRSFTVTLISHSEEGG